MNKAKNYPVILGIIFGGIAFTSGISSLYTLTYRPREMSELFFFALLKVSIGLVILVITLLVSFRCKTMDLEKRIKQLEAGK